MPKHYRPPYTVGQPTSYLTRDPTAFDVAVVGNGPLHEFDRVAINSSANVIRFNDMNHRRVGEPTTLHVIRYPSALKAKHPCNATIWAVSDSPNRMPPGKQLYTWTYAWGLSHPSLLMPEKIFFPEAQVLEPWVDSVRLFEDCAECGLRCHLNQSASGASTGAWILSELEADDKIGNIVFTAAIGQAGWST